MHQVECGIFAGHAHFLTCSAKCLASAGHRLADALAFVAPRGILFYAMTLDCWKNAPTLLVCMPYQGLQGVVNGQPLTAKGR